MGGPDPLCLAQSEKDFLSNFVEPPKNRGFKKSSFANGAFWSASGAFAWVREARAVGFDSSELPGRSVGRPVGRQLRRQLKKTFSIVLGAAGRKRFYANGEPLSPHL